MRFDAMVCALWWYGIVTTIFASVKSEIVVNDAYLFICTMWSAISQSVNGTISAGQYVAQLGDKIQNEITVSNQFPTKLPIVRELSGCMAENYAHCYENGQLCLASDLELKMYFSQESDICSFIEKYIAPYLYTYRYYEEYGVYPFGERSHGVLGDLEYLKELFGVAEWNVFFDMLFFVSTSSYRGHLACPCGSGKRIRNCHGDVIKMVVDAKLENDCKAIIEEILMFRKEYVNGKYNKAIRTI